jgi:hypothetical protein
MIILKVRYYSHELSSYIFPSSDLPIFFVTSDKPAYFASTPAAYAHQDRWRDEAGIDVLQRMASKLQETTGMMVQVAREEDGREYYAGILRAVDAGMHVHTDFAPYVSSINLKFWRISTTSLNTKYICRRLWAGLLAGRSRSLPGTSSSTKCPVVTHSSTIDSGALRKTTWHGERSFLKIRTIRRCWRATPLRP